jgi:hypothetical protein
MNIDEVDIKNPTKEEAEYIMKLLDERTKEYPKGTFVITEEYHPDGGQGRRIRSEKEATQKLGKREGAPYILSFFKREYYESILNEFAEQDNASSCT